jgi:hypothetical protein
VIRLPLYQLLLDAMNCFAIFLLFFLFFIRMGIKSSRIGEAVSGLKLISLLIFPYLPK